MNGSRPTRNSVWLSPALVLVDPIYSGIQWCYADEQLHWTFLDRTWWYALDRTWWWDLQLTKNSFEREVLWAALRA